MARVKKAWGEGWRMGRGKTEESDQLLIPGDLIFKTYEGHRRSMYVQSDGGTILADSCTCYKDGATCPINKHSIAARQPAVAATADTP